MFIVSSHIRIHLTESDVAVSDEYVGTYSAVDGNGVPTTITIDADDMNFYFCLQDMFRFKDPVAFPAIARLQPVGFEWMTSDQEMVSNMLGWTCVAILFFVALLFVNRILIRFLRNVFSSPYKVSGRATKRKEGLSCETLLVLCTQCDVAFGL